MIKEQNQQDEEMNEFKEEIVNVNCSYCGKEIECPKNMLNEIEKHACLDCFKNLDKKQYSDKNAKVHIDIPLNEIMSYDESTLLNFATITADSMTNDVFPKFWNDAKNEVKDLSKKGLAEEMFHAGAVNMLYGYLKLTEEMSKKNNKKEGEEEE